MALIYALAIVAAVLAVASIGACRWGVRRKLAITSAWLSTMGVVTAGVMGYARTQAALRPALWEPRALPTRWPEDVLLTLCAGWIVASVVWAIAVARAQPRGPSMPPPASASPWHSNFVSASETGRAPRPRVRYRIVTDGRRRARR